MSQFTLGIVVNPSASSCWWVIGWITNFSEDREVFFGCVLYVPLRCTILFFFFLLPFLHLLTCVYIVWSTSPNLLSLPYTPTSGHNLFFPLLWFCWRENIGDNKKDRVFLLVWDRDIPSIAFMYMCIKTHVSSSFPDLFTTFWAPYHSGLSQFKVILFAPLQWAHQSHSSFRFPFLSLFLPCGSLLSVWPMSNNITALVLGL
jgi:hypothetical protein